jgi:hypothetical protein
VGCRRERHGDRSSNGLADRGDALHATDTNALPAAAARIVLNGTSSVLYGTVPELSDGDTGRAFAIFYTSVIGSGGIAPILYGAIADHSNQTVGALASAATALLIVPLVLTLKPHVRNRPAGSYERSM